MKENSLEKVIPYLVKRMNEKADQVGAASVQAMVYFLTRMGIVNPEFSMYNYGPSSSEVLAVLKKLRDVLDVSWDPLKGYVIKLASNANPAEPEARAKEAVDYLIKKLGEKSPRELSLIAVVLHFRDRLSEDRIIETVRCMRPQFSEREVMKAVKTVKEVFG